jgi:DNA-binding NarL/FixJ family response regulator
VGKCIEREPIMISVNLQHQSVLTALVTCSIRVERQQAFLEHIAHFWATDAQSPESFSIMFLPPPFQHLSPRELEVLKLVTEGYSNREIGENLHLSCNTIKTYVRSLMNKFGVERRIQLVVAAMAIDPLGNSSTLLTKAS